MSDYLKEGDAGFKKPKVRQQTIVARICLTVFPVQKKKAKRSARKADGDEEEGNGMEVDDGVPTFARRVVGDGPENLVDDDDLQASISRARRAAAKNRPKRRPEDLAAQSESGLLPFYFLLITFCSRRTKTGGDRATR